MCIAQIPCEGHEGPPDAFAVYHFYMRVMRASAEMRADEEARGCSRVESVCVAVRGFPSLCLCLLSLAAACG